MCQLSVSFPLSSSNITFQVRCHHYASSPPPLLLCSPYFSSKPPHQTKCSSHTKWVRHLGGGWVIENSVRLGWMLSGSGYVCIGELEPSKMTRDLMVYNSSVRMEVLQISWLVRMALGNRLRSVREINMWQVIELVSHSFHFYWFIVGAWCKGTHFFFVGNFFLRPRASDSTSFYPVFG